MPAQMKVVIIGAGRWGTEVAEVLSEQGHEVVGWLDDNRAREGETFAGKPILGPVARLEGMRDRTIGVHVAVGKPSVRLALVRQAQVLGHAVVSAVHPRSVVMRSVRIGPGCFVGPCAVLGSGCRVGVAAVVHMGCTIGHDSVLEDGVFLGSGVHSGGGLHIGEGSFICPGVTIVAGVRIGRGSVVSSGVMVARDVPDGSVLSRLANHGLVLTEGNIDWDRVVSGI